MMGLPGEERAEKKFEKIKAENLPNLIQDMNLYIQKAQETSSNISTKRSTLKHRIINYQRKKETLEGNKKEMTHRVQKILKKNIQFLLRNHVGQETVG